VTLTDVSKTAVSTLRCRAIESKKPKPILKDPMAEFCLERLGAIFSAEDRALLFDRKLSPQLVNHITIRARKYDAIVNEFISTHPDCTVVNLGCGFDTRYWRIDHEKCSYFELDLPEIISLKREILKDRLDYTLIGCSVDVVAVPDRGHTPKAFLIIAHIADLIIGFAAHQAVQGCNRTADAAGPVHPGPLRHLMRHRCPSRDWPPRSCRWTAGSSRRSPLDRL
jgi:O-methyltransferase involved in polyketide biosynthesis